MDADNRIHSGGAGLATASVAVLDVASHSARAILDETTITRRGLADALIEALHTVRALHALRAIAVADARANRELLHTTLAILYDRNREIEQLRKRYHALLDERRAERRGRIGA